MDHMGAQAVRSHFSAPSVSYERNGQPATFWGLAGSASRRSDKNVVVTVVNPSATDARETELVVRGAQIASFAIRTLTAPALDAHNSFEQPDAMPAPADMVPDWKGAPLVLTFPKASVSRVLLKLV
jgi:alpha-N-arabinofuranosidase